MISTRVGRVDYTECGDGHPVVLLHATLHNRHDFDPIVDTLATRFRVIAIDWPGHGGSDPGRPTAEVLADVLEDVVDELALPRAAYIGNSVGGFAAGRLAARRPDAVSHLVLVNPGGFAPLPPVARIVARTIGTPAVARVVMPRMVPAYMRSLTDSDRAIESGAQARARTSEGARVAATLWRSFTSAAYDLSASEISAPALVVWGKRDPLFPSAPAARTTLPVAEFDTGHVVFSSDPDGFLGVVLPFLVG